MLSIVSITLAFLIGILWGLYLEIKFLFIASIFLVLLVLMFYKNINFKLKYSIGIINLVCIIGCIYTRYNIEKFDTKYIHKDNTKINVIITSHLEESDYTYKYNCKSSNGDKFILYFKKNEDCIFNIGNNLIINGEFKLPDVQRNRGGFNYRRYLNSNGFYGVINVSYFNVLEDNNGIISSLVYKIQNLIHYNFLEVLRPEFAGILSGMLIGETSLISDETKENFQLAGITHLLAVSGSNVAIVISFSGMLIIKLFGKKYSDYISIIFIIFFVLLSGASPSVVRAGIMATLNLGANIFSKQSSSILNIVSSAFFILVFNPLAILNVGFLLSFAGTIGILVFSKIIKSFFEKYIKMEFFCETISLNLSAQLVILPIMMYFFNSISLVSIVANLLIVPVTSILTFGGIFLIFISMVSIKISRLFALLLNPIINYIVVMAEFMARFDILNFLVPTPKICVVIWFYVVLYFVYDRYLEKNDNYLERIRKSEFRFINRYIRKSLYIIGTIIVSLLIINKFIFKNYTEFTAIDVGQGDSFFIVTEKGKRILIDGGGSETSDYDVGKNVLMPYLLDRGFLKIDYIFVSHAHADHIDGIYTILENFDVNTVFVGAQNKNDEKFEKLLSIAKSESVSINKISKGDIIKIDDLVFEILYPSFNEKNDNVNNLSLVMNLYCNGRKICFTGDAEKEVEEKLIKECSDKLKEIDILKIGHHGAKTSSSEDFIEVVKPKISVVSVAKENKYGHPNIDVISRLKNFGEVILTSDSGEVNFKIYNNGNINADSVIK